MTVPDSTLASSRMLLRRSKQVFARSADDACVLDLGIGHGVLGVVLELLGEDQQAVERACAARGTCWR